MSHLHTPSQILLPKAPETGCICNATPTVYYHLPCDPMEWLNAFLNNPPPETVEISIDCGTVIEVSDYQIQPAEPTQLVNGCDGATEGIKLEGLVQVTLKAFLADVMEELQILKPLIKQHHLNHRLDISTFSPYSTTDCVLGQLFGSSCNAKSKATIPKTYNLMALRTKHKDSSKNTLAAIEVYVENNYKQFGKIKNVYAYLKGEIDTIDL